MHIYIKFKNEELTHEFVRICTTWLLRRNTRAAGTRYVLRTGDRHQGPWRGPTKIKAVFLLY